MSQALVPSVPGPVRPGIAPPVDAPKAGDNPLLLLHKLLRGRYLIAILLAGLFGPCGAAIGYYAVQLEYTSSATIRIAPVLPKVLFESEQNSMMPMFDSFLQTQVSLIRDRRVIDEAMRNEAWRKAGGDFTSLEAVQKFSESLTVLQPKSSQLILVSYTDEDPGRAQAAATAVVDSYMKVYGETDKIKEGTRIDILEKREQSQLLAIEAVRADILKEASDYGTNDLGEAYALELGRLQELQSELAEAKLQLAAIEALSGGPEATETLDYSKLTVDEIGTMDARMQGLLDERKRLQREIDDYKATIRRPEARPEYRRAVENLKSQEAEIEAYAGTFRENASRGTAMAATNTAGAFTPMVTAEQLRAKVEGLQKYHDEAKTRTVELGNKNLRLKEFQAKLTRLQEDLEVTSARLEQLNVESNPGGRITPLGPAEFPTGPSNAKRRIQLVILGGLAGGGVGVGLVLLLGLFNARLRDIEDAQDIRPRLLGALPLLPNSLTSLPESMVAAQCVHQIRAILHSHMPPHETLSLTITAPNSGAGKTSFALSLGLSFASAGTRTLIIDGDVIGTGLTHRTGAAGRCKLGHVLRKHDVISDEEFRHALNLSQKSGRRIGHSLLELGYISEMDLEDGLNIQEDSGLGLTDALNGEHFEDCLADIGVPNLSILPASRRTVTPTNAMSPAAVRNLLGRLRSSFDVILIDAGPVPGTTDSTIMATCADGVIMVASRGDQGSDAQRSLRHLQELDVFVVGLVFNRAEAQDIERSRYSSSVSVSRSEATAKRNVEEDNPAELADLLEPVSGFGPLPQSVWLSTMHPAVFKDSGVPV